MKSNNKILNLDKQQELYKFNYDKAIKDKDIILKEINYPYLKYFTDEKELRRRFENLKVINAHVINRPYYINFVHNHWCICYHKIHNKHLS